ncbi:hypothetical protein ACQKIE_16080 [Luteibacter sp. NPDC031894]|uniref:hypothetical protein n=1 Tax=Luteibacter sp. NPDC031894 TaxID=3390572 RepID=UPI003CFF503C
MAEQNPAATTDTTAAADATPETQTPPAGDAKPANTETPATPDAKPEGDKPEGDGKPKDGDKTAPKAPEKYELSVPEGFQLEPETTAEFEQIAREFDLDNDQANKLIPLGVKLAQRIEAKQAETHQSQVAQWADAVRNDKELGGANFDATVATAKKALDRFGTPELKQLMDTSGFGNHPEIVRAFHRIGQAIADDTFVNAPSGGGTSGKSPASVLFDHPTSQPQR